MTDATLATPAPNLDNEPAFQALAKLRGALLLLRDADEIWYHSDEVQFADRLIRCASEDVAALAEAIDAYTTYHGHREHLRQRAAEAAAHE